MCLAVGLAGAIAFSARLTVDSADLGVGLGVLVFCAARTISEEENDSAEMIPGEFIPMGPALWLRSRSELVFRSGAAVQYCPTLAVFKPSGGILRLVRTGWERIAHVLQVHCPKEHVDVGFTQTTLFDSDQPCSL